MDYNFEAGNTGEDIGAQALHKGKPVGTAYTEFHPGESKRRGSTVVRSRIEVDPEHQRKGLGSKLVEILMQRLAGIGDVTHQEGFSTEGEAALRQLYEDAGYEEVEPGVWEKKY